VWNANDPAEGHAVNPYAVVDMGNGIIHILVYDNNAPRETGVVEVDRNNNTWSYNLSVNPSVEPSIWSGDANTQTMFLAPNSQRMGTQPLPFDPPTITSSLPGQSLLRTNSATQEFNAISLTSDDHTYADILFTDADGHKFGYEGKTLHNEIPGAFIQRLPSDKNNPIEPLYFIPVGIKFTITLDGSQLSQPTVNHLLMIGPGYDLSLDDISMAPGDMDTVEFAPDGSEISYTPSSSEAPNIGLVIVTSAADYEFNLLGSDVDSGGTIHVDLDYDKGQLMLHTSGNDNPVLYDLLVDRYDDKSQQTFQHDGLQLEPTETVYFDFGKWDGEGELDVFVDAQSDGTIDQTETEGNQK
jgi:hypothetical protein